MPLLDGPSLGGNARHVLRQYAEENALARGRGANAAGTEEFGGGCLRGRYNNLREVIQNNPSLVVVPSIINAGSLFVQRPICRTNYLPNNSMAGATGGVLPTNWSIGSLPAGITVSYSASGTAVAADGTSVNYIDVTVSGTAGASGFLNIRPNPSPSTIAAFVGQSWNTSVYLQLISGSVASISPTWQLQELNSLQGFLQGSNIGGLGSLVVGGQFDRYNVSRVLTDSATAFVTCRWGHSFVSGTTYSYTLRIGSPQLERFSVPTPMIATSTGAVTRLNESTNVVGLPPDFTVSRNTTATRVNSSGLIESVASGVPRIDWLGQSCPALLVEPSGQNTFIESQTLFTTHLVQNLTSGYTNAATSPDGSVTAEKFVPNTTNGVHGIANGSSLAISSGTTYTFSLFVKSDGGPYNLISLTFDSATAWGATRNCIFNASNGTNFSVPAGATMTSENYGNGWYRIRATLTAVGNVAASLYQYRIYVCDALGSLSWAAPSSNTNGIFCWGAQLEVGSVATTYIPTTSGTGSRAAETISASGALVSGLIGQTEGTIYAEVDVRQLVGSVAKTFIDIGATNNRIFIGFTSLASNTIRLQIDTSASPARVDIRSAVSSAGIIKVAAAYQSGNCVLYVNGVAGTVSANDPLSFSTLSSVFIGQTIAGTAFLNDRIRAAALYTTRLSNDQLAELTRL